MKFYDMCLISNNNMVILNFEKPQIQFIFRGQHKFLSLLTSETARTDRNNILILYSQDMTRSGKR